MANMDYFYDAQIRRYLLQFMRIFSEFQVSEGKRNGVTYYNKTPVRYADMQRMVAHILKKGSENMVNSTPFIACSINSLLIARDRVHEPMLVDKLQIAERQFDSTANAYSTSANASTRPGNLYSTDRYMPVPYNLTMQVDIWSGNTDQKLQLLEQILNDKNQFVCFLSGAGGTGKSRVINGVRHYCKLLCNELGVEFT